MSWLGLALPALAATDTMPAVQEGKSGNLIAMEAPNGTIRGAVYHLMRGMLAYEKGKHDEAEGVLTLFEPPPDMSQEMSDRFLLNAAKHLSLVLQNVDFDPQSLPLDPPGNKFRMRLGEGDLHLVLHMVRLQDGSWVFSLKMADSPQIKTLYEEYKDRYDKLTRADMEGKTFEPNLMSPFRTVLTLFSGVRDELGYDLRDAASTLDLSHVSPLVREQLGEIWAFMLYRVLVYASSVNVEELSADPNSQRMPILLTIPGTGVITLQVREDPETEITSWVFPRQSIEAALEAYTPYMAEGMAELVRTDPNVRGGDPPAYILVDDFFQEHAPGLETRILGNRVWKWLVLLALIAVSPLIWRIAGLVFRGVGGLLHLFDERGLNRSRRLVVIPAQVIALGLLWSSCLVFVTLAPGLLKVLELVLSVFISIAVAWLICLGIDLVTHWMSGLARSKVRQTMILVVGQVFKAGVALAAMANIAALFGQDSTRILTALGLGGVALALAFKQTLENVFGTFTVLYTRPFAIGDRIVVQDVEGIVENVGIRSTMIRTFYNSLVTVPNATFITQPVDNYGKRSFRRYRTVIRLSYDTPSDKADAYVRGLRDAVLSMERTRKDYFHIRLHDFGESALEVLVNIFFSTDDWGVELAEREEFIRRSVRLAEELGVRFALPGRAVRLERADFGAGEAAEG